MTDALMITVRDLYSVPDFKGGTGYCGSGARRWFAHYGFDWQEFVKNGLPASVLAATGDALALQVIAHAAKAVVLTDDLSHG
ncbi:hypothetical protein [Glaciimonas immobilis]|uniref:Uncharacterized protein n=1 Tax=Glaciimonas immobilis TaxID=728004 RepID=A0A840RL54_9BURK|nr:hypothetical protein [Glaciimonas immobilis]KAF3999072.1 hypothetical protein HAV38_03765 [Glaciimonas immobilis]MBB5198503.1 hypothetical protein [Glaciimonas immobilis]